MLVDILEHARRRADAASLRLTELRAAARDAPPARAFGDALDVPGLQVIAELKRRSPSAGVLTSDLDVGAQAARYAAGGAAALSVLTDPEHFGGSLRDLTEARAAVALPVLRKDFLLDEAQVWEARAVGADAVLLIVAALTDGRLERLLAVVEEAGMDALVEVHTEVEADRAIEAGARVVGVNNRDLRTFVTDPAVAERLSPVLGGVRLRVAESGVSDPEVARRMAEAGYDAVLVGEALMRSSDPAALIAALRGGS